MGKSIPSLIADALVLLCVMGVSAPTHPMPGTIVSDRRFIAKLAKSGTVTRMETRTPQKLYAYVDESGQDTLGAFFVVATVLTADNQERVRQALERLERASGKGLRKWVKATPRQRLAYMTPVLAVQEGPCDNTPFPLSHCYTCISILIPGEEGISPVGRNRLFCRLLTSKDTIFGPFS
jgi:hypothetical protein